MLCLCDGGECLLAVFVSVSQWRIKSGSKHTETNREGALHPAASLHLFVVTDPVELLIVLGAEQAARLGVHA